MFLTLKLLEASEKEGDLFSFIDKTIIKILLGQLTYIEQRIIYLKFWENHTIDEISSLTKKKWEKIFEILENTKTKLKSQCLSDPAFSRSTKSDHETSEQTSNTQGAVNHE